jgi:hypothetical protein
VKGISLGGVYLGEKNQVQAMFSSCNSKASDVLIYS